MLPTLLERQPDLEFSTTVRAFCWPGAGDSSADSFAEFLDSLRVRCTRDAAAAEFRVLVIDLRGVVLDAASLDLLDVFAAEQRSTGRHVAAVGAGVAGEHVTALPSREELYRWLAEAGVRRNVSDPIPLFTMTEEEIAGLRREGHALSAVLSELEAVPESA